MNLLTKGGRYRLTEAFTWDRPDGAGYVFDEMPAGTEFIVIDPIVDHNDWHRVIIEVEEGVCRRRRVGLGIEAHAEPLS